MNEIAEVATAGNGLKRWRNGYGRGDKEAPKTPSRPETQAQNDQRPPEMTTGTATVEDNIPQRHSDAHGPKILATTAAGWRGWSYGGGDSYHPLDTSKERSDCDGSRK